MQQSLKGQNVRLATIDELTGEARVFAKSTSCTVTLNVNTDDTSTKDDVSLASKPTATSQSWQLSLESLEVSDVVEMLAAIKSMQPITVLYDEVSTADNQTALGAAFARSGKAYINDVTFNFNDREISSKSIQLQGIGELQKLQGAPEMDIIEVDSNYLRGQYVRLFLGGDGTTTPAAVLAASKSLSLHVSLSLEDSTTKDTPGTWTIQEPTGLSFDITTSALVRSADTITSSVPGKTFADLEDIKEAMSPVRFEIAHVGGANNRTKQDVIVAGLVLVTSITNNNPNRQNSTWDCTLSGYGAYEVPSES